MTPERFLYFVLLIIAIVIAVFVGVWAVGEITESDPAMILPFYEGITQ